MKKHLLKLLATYFCLLFLLCGCVDNLPTTNTSTTNATTTTVISADTTKASQTTKKVKTTKTKKSTDTKNIVKLHVLNVGQGTSLLFETNGHFLLYDGGPAKASSYVVSYLQKQGVKTLDYIVVSHYDSDHLNGVVGALHAFDVKNVIAPDYTADSNIYASYKSALKTKHLKPIASKAGKTYSFGKASFQILAPNGKHYQEENDYSTVLRMTNGKNSFLASGDAANESEAEMVANNLLLKSDVYIVSHHGSAYASSTPFLQKVAPTYSVISCGEGNSYGHPAAKALARIKQVNSKLYRTDTQGTIVFESNGTKISCNKKPTGNWAAGARGNNKSNKVTTAVSSSTNNAKDGYIGNIKTKKYHRTSCSGLPYEKNRVYFKTKKAAESAGYEPCKRCNP